MEIYILSIFLICYTVAKKVKTLSFWGLLGSVAVFHIFGFLSLAVVAIMEMGVFKGIAVILLSTIVLTLAAARPTPESNRWLWHKKPKLNKGN